MGSPGAARDYMERPPYVNVSRPHGARKVETRAQSMASADGPGLDGAHAALELFAHGVGAVGRGLDLARPLLDLLGVSAGGDAPHVAGRGLGAAVEGRALAPRPADEAIEQGAASGDEGHAEGDWVTVRLYDA